MALTPTSGSSFSYSFLVLPADQRRAITALLQFCRAVDDSVDLETDSARALAALDEWRAEVARLFGTTSPSTAQGRRLQPFIETFRLPRDQFDALVDGVAMDASPRRYGTFADVLPYCHGVASSVGLICARIFRYRNPAALEYARDLGVALQLTNILRDVAVDLKRDRFYLPGDDLERFGCSEGDFRREVEQAGSGVRSERVRKALAQHASRAHEYFARARRALPPEDAPKFVAAEIMSAIYRELLRRIEASRYDVFSRLIRVERPAQAWIAVKTWWSLR
jgi:phytoene synthase